MHGHSDSERDSFGRTVEPSQTQQNGHQQLRFPMTSCFKRFYFIFLMPHFTNLPD